MRPVSLTLRGFIGIWKGMNKEEITLDLSSLSGLIAFDGKVGRGKSSVLDNLHPFRQLASRENALQHHVCLRDSFKEYTFELNGNRYRTLVKIDARSGRQEGYIYINGSTASEVSGKTTEYDKYIEGLLGSPKLFFQSAFAAQGGKSIADLTEGETKKLFSEFLQLDRLIEYENSAKRAANTVANQIETIRRRVKTKEEQVADKPAIERELSEKDSRLTTLNTSIEQTRAKSEALDSELERARQAAAAHKAAEQRKQELAKEKTDLESRAKSRDTAWADYEKSINAKIASVRKSVADKQAALKNQGQLRKTRVELQSLDEELPEKERAVEAARRELESAQTKIEDRSRALSEFVAETNKKIEQQQARIDEYTKESQETERLKAETEAKLQALEKDGELTRLQYRKKELETTVAKKDMLPEECNSGICPFIADSRKAEAELPKVEKALEKRRVEIKYQTDQLRAALPNKEKEAEIKKALDRAASRKKELAGEIGEGKKSFNAQIEAATKARDKARSRVEGLEKQISGIKARQSRLRKAIDGMPNFETLEAEIKNLNIRIDELSEELARRRAEYDNQAAELKSRISKTVSAITALPLDPKAEEVARKKSAELEQCKKSVKDTEAEISSLQSQAAVLRHRLQECARVKEKIAADRQVIVELNAELAEWRYIQQACGKDGLRALEIDGTAPMIAQCANDLLTTTFGPGATVDFRTLDDEGKECLDIVVYRDSDEDDRGTLLKNLSGGQQVWILKALRLALTLVSKQKSGRDIAVALSDEEDGALDEESAVNFIELYRAFMQVGGFETCIYITHRDACKQMADHVIRFTEQGIGIESKNAAEAAA